MGRGNLDLNVVQEILNKTKEEVENMHPVNILLAGKTGVGKSTLINNVFRERMAETGIGKPVTKHLRRIAKEGMPIVLYDTRGLELGHPIQTEVKKEIIEAIKKSQTEDPIRRSIWSTIASMHIPPASRNPRLPLWKNFPACCRCWSS